MDLKYVVITALIVILAGGGFFASTKLNYVSPEKVDMLLEDGTRVLTAKVTELSTIRDSLESRSAVSLALIDSLEHRIVASIGVSLQIAVYRDSVQSLSDKLAQASTAEIIRVVQADRDTTLSWSQTFNEGLFEVTSRVGFTAQSITNHLDLRMARQPEIDFIVSEGGAGELTFFAQSRDFDIDFNYVHQTEPLVFRPSWPERNWQYIGAGTFVLGVLLGR